MKVLFISAVLVWTTIAASPALFLDTCDRVARHGFSCEEHNVQTSDGYILTLFRMQHSNLLNNHMENNKPAVLVMHGLLSSSDSWVLNGPNDGLVYLLAAAGHDVWLGNARGNNYSQKHVSKLPVLSFWDFCWHEIGIYDIPAMIDYIIDITGQTGVHYVGHSQGTTAFMVTLSTVPSCNAKIKTSHLLAPPIFLGNMSSVPLAMMGLLLDKPNLLTSLLGTTEIVPSDELIRFILPQICKQKPLQEWCNNVVILLGGGPSPYTNFSTFEEYFQTHPSGSSVRQLVHYIQERGSGKFRPYDFGHTINWLRYGAAHPPDYQLQNVNTSHPIDLYFSDNDDWVAVEDVHRLRDILREKVTLNHISLPEFNHVDFTIASNIKDVLGDCIVDRINQYENMPYSGHLCTYFKS